MNWWSKVLVAVALLGTARAADAQQRPAVAKVPAVGPTVRATSSVTSPHGTELREPCASCHKANAWKPVRIAPTFRHAERTFPLSGAHERATCGSCHKSQDFQNTPTTCASCHADTHKGEFGVSCARCHNTRSFIDRGTAVRTHQATRFPLRGAHAIATCEACHARTGPGQLQFASRGTTCQGCHQATFRATRSPNHVAAHFSSDCTSCHTISSWSGAVFDHNTTKFALTGRHQTATCQGCHTDNVYTGRSTNCVSCHQTDYAGALEPKHSQGFPTACESCHGTAQWKGARFDHNTQTKYPLTGKHVAATCASCHKTGSYAGTPSTCLSCHQPDVDRTSKPPHAAAGFSSSCEGCHNTGTWLGAPFDHATTRFALTGSHRAVSCQGCHADNVFRGKPMACASCHQGKADATTNPHHAQARFASTCESCHTTTAWAGARYDHAQTRFPLTGGHVSQTCLACHSDRVYAGKPALCVSCHQRNYDLATQPDHRQLGFPTACESCHTTARWDGGRFDHATTTRFALTGAHLALTCRSCHSDGVFRGKPMTCVGCHQTTYNATTTPHHEQARFATTCESCHTTQQWRGVPYDHNQTRFPLLGKHVSATCLACHSDRVYAGKPSVCQSCHQREFDATTAPNHRTTGIPATCETCHSSTAWKPATFDHNTTQFPLAGAHRAVNCQSCHSDGVYRGKATACASCHQGKYDATTQPNHRTSGYATTCESCHTVIAWKPAAFDHTRFPLNGAHRSATCASCHADGVFQGKPSTCVSCHQSKFDATTRPNHRTTGIGTTCESCHTVTAWTPATFNHSATRFPLTGAHVSATCLACHNDGVYRGKPTACASCHQGKYDATTQPNHRTSGYATTCESCHTVTAWKPAAFDHTRFPLNGAHRSATCASCHADGVFRGKPSTCVSCHQSKFDATTRPNHRTSGIGTTCESCHTVTAWTPASFDHAVTRFPLAGAHRAVSCAGCHADGVYRGKPTTCVGCHQAKFDATTQPNHRTSGIPTTCETCHSVVTWKPATFDHAATRFPLAGAHRTATCGACHGDGVYRGKPTTCVSCHQARFDATTRPNHRTAGIATTCESCHSVTAWTPATFNHAATRFPLTGAHVSATCLACHSDGVYRGKPTLCASCHTSDYNATTNPNHRTAFFPTTCESCHTTARWTGATFNHDGPWFPIYSGKHREKWSTCAQCHTNSANYREFTCLSCHEHNQTKMDDKHRGRAGYRYESATCYACHPRGDS